MRSHALVVTGIDSVGNDATVGAGIERGSSRVDIYGGRP